MYSRRRGAPLIKLRPTKKRQSRWAHSRFNINDKMPLWLVFEVHRTVGSELVERSRSTELVETQFTAQKLQLRSYPAVEGWSVLDLELAPIIGEVTQITSALDSFHRRRDPGTTGLQKSPARDTSAAV
mgnify:CR=1 FL=1